MDFNFFDWIRNGVKSSVLMGVSDAVEEMGMPTNQESSRDKILSFLQNDDEQQKLPNVAPGAPVRRRLAGGGTTTKKLGRSIADIHKD